MNTQKAKNGGAEMSKPRYLWWGFVRAMIREYPKLKSDLDDLQAQSTTASLTGMPRGGGNGRTVEGLALRQLPKDSMSIYEAVSGASQITKARADGQERMRLIFLMYWAKKPRTMQAAALHLHISDATAKRWHGEFVRLVAKRYGFNVDTPEPK